jgi:hypothetical protein
MEKIVHLVLSEDGPIKNPMVDKSSVKEEISNKYPPLGEEIYVSSGKKQIKQEEQNPLKDFSKKYYFDSYEVALATAQEKSRNNPGKSYFVARTISRIISEVKEPEVMPLASNG